MVNSGKMESQLYHNIVFNKFKKHFPEATEVEINETFFLRNKENIYCYYCGRKLKYPTDYPYYDTPSIDHKTPKVCGGKNEFNNIAICCFQCNIVKGTMMASSYKKMLELLNKDPNWKEIILNEIFIGRRANMLARKKKEDQREAMVSDFM